jgi:hypothetical protein
VDSNKHIVEDIVRQVDYLPELYEDARSKKYKIFAFFFLSSTHYIAWKLHNLVNSREHDNTNNLIRRRI